MVLSSLLPILLYFDCYFCPNSIKIGKLSSKKSKIVIDEFVPIIKERIDTVIMANRETFVDNNSSGAFVSGILGGPLCELCKELALFAYYCISMARGNTSKVDLISNKHNTKFILHGTIVMLLIASNPAYAYKDIGCQTTALAVSNITDCIGNICTAKYINNLAIVASENTWGCVNFPALAVNGTNIVPPSTLKTRVLGTHVDHDLELEYICPEIKCTYNAFCEKSSIPSGANCEKNSRHMNLTTDIAFCIEERGYASDGKANSIKDYYTFVVCTIRERFQVFKVKRPSTEFVLEFEKDNATAYSIWDGVTLDKLVVGAKTMVNLIGSNIGLTPQVSGDRFVIDNWAPYDGYMVNGINSAGEHNPSKYCPIQILPDGTKKMNYDTLKTALVPKLISCNDASTRSSLLINLPHLEVELESQKNDNQGVRQQFDGTRFYDEDGHRINDAWSLPQPSYTHNTQIAQDMQEYTIDGYTSDDVYWDMLTSFSPPPKPIRIGYVAGKCSVMFDGKSADSTGVFNIQRCDTNGTWANSTHNGYVITCDKVATAIPSSNQAVYRETWKTAAGYGWFAGGLTSFQYMRSDGSCDVVDFLSQNRGLPAPHNVGNKHLKIPFQKPVTVNYQIEGEQSGIFVSANVVPEITTISDSPSTRTINITIRSKGDVGPVTIHSSPPGAFTTKTIGLSADLQTITLSRLTNISQTIQVIVCANPCLSANKIVKYFPTVNVTDEQDFTDYDPTEDNTTDTHHVTNDPQTWFHVPGDLWKKLDWKQKVIAVIERIAIGLAIVIVIIIIIVLLMKCGLNKHFLMLPFQFLKIVMMFFAWPFITLFHYINKLFNHTMVDERTKLRKREDTYSPEEGRKANTTVNSANLFQVIANAQKRKSSKKV